MQYPDIKLDDLLQMRKPHPCGSYIFSVYRMGADIGIECTGCGRRVLLERRSLFRRLRRILPPADDAE